nr:hypothetical protein BCMPIHFP_00005 [Enterococcus faecium]
MYWQKRLDRKNPDQEIEAESRRIQLNLNTMKWMPKALSVKRNCI